MADFKDIIKEIEAAVEKFNKGIPAAQRSMYDEIELQLRDLELNKGNIKATVSNLRIINKIKSKISSLILTDDYLDEVKKFIKTFDKITDLQNEYWKSIESTFKPSKLLGEIKTQAITDTVNSLTEQGIGSIIAESVTQLLRTNITSGGSIKDLQNQLKTSVVGNKEGAGLVERYAKQITTDSVNQYSAQYTQAVSNDLGYEWFAYQGSDIVTTRPFCDAMTDRRYFHVTEIPALLQAEGLFYIKDGKETKVPIYEKTGLPNGMIEGTNPQNFFINRGGYNCGHQIRPVGEGIVPQDIKNRVFATPQYRAWKG